MGDNTVTIRNNMVPAVMRRLADISNGVMEVGYFADGGGGKTYKNGKTVSEVAVFHEFGTSKMPARPFMSEGTDLFRRDQRAVARIIRIAINGGLSGRQLAERMGKIYRLKIRTVIRRGDFTPLSDRTVKIKGHDTVLRDTDAMYNGLENRVK